MTEFGIERELVERFLTLNDFSGVNFVKDKNVDFSDNKTFSIPKDKRWFKLSFLSDEGENIGIGNFEQSRFSGIFQIDIYTPIDKGREESETKYEWISKLFKKGTCLKDVSINRVYKALQEVEENGFRTVVRVEWTADIIS